MILGCSVSFYGIYNQDTVLVYLGLAVIATTCVSWWVWVMLVIRSIIRFTQNAALNISDIRDGIKDVRQLFQEYENLRKR